MRSLANQNASIMDDVMEILFTVFPDDNDIAVWENYSNDSDVDCIIAEQINATYIQDNEETIEVRFTSHADNTRRASRIIDLAVDGIDKSNLCSVVQRFNKSMGFTDDSGEPGIAMASQVVRVR